MKDARDSNSASQVLCMAGGALLRGLVARRLPAEPACSSYLLHMLRGLLALLEAALALLLLLLPGGRGAGGLLLRLSPSIGRRMARWLQGPPVRSHAVRTCRSPRRL